jgi:septation ring formation regulator EzrA
LKKQKAFSTFFQLTTEQAQKTKRLLKLMQTFNTLVDKFHTQGETKNAYSVILDSIKSIESQLKHLRSGIKDLNGIVSAYDGGTDDETLIYNIKKFGDGG